MYGKKYKLPKIDLVHYFQAQSLDLLCYMFYKNIRYTVYFPFIPVFLCLHKILG